MTKKDFVLGIDYYLENGKVIMTEHYHKERGHCCGSDNGCRHCPYMPECEKGNQVLKEKINLKKDLEN